MTLDTQVNLARKDKGSFYNQKKWWLVECEYGKGIYYSEYDDHKNCLSSDDKGSNWEEGLSEEDVSSDSDMEELPTAYSCCVLFLVFPPFSPIFYCFFQALRKGFSRISMIQKCKSKI